MKSIHMLFTTIFALVAVGKISAEEASPPAAPVEVTCFESEKFTDVRARYLGTSKEDEDILWQLADFIRRRAPRYVPAGGRLAVTLTDIDLAGDFEPWRGPPFDEVRIIREIYPPRIELSFQLIDAAGKVVKQGTRELRDLSFQMGLASNRDDALRYEKALLENWLRTDFGG